MSGHTSDDHHRASDGPSLVAAAGRDQDALPGFRWGQQGRLLAAAGAEVTVFDNSAAQLAGDRLVAEREGLEIGLVEGDMRDLSVFGDGSFDLVVLPVANLFVPDVRPMWREAHRVLRLGGLLLAGFKNPVCYVIGRHRSHQEDLRVRYRIPYSDLTSVGEEERLFLYGPTAPLEFGHSLSDQIGGQIEAGFMLTDFVEDSRPDLPLSAYIDEYIATRAVRV